MTPQPHPLRCETCDHYNGGEYFDKCKNEIFPDNMDSTERQYIKDWISSHGCASHSAASRPAPSSAKSKALIFIPKPSTELILIAEQEWDKKQRQQHDKVSWISGFLEGYFSKPVNIQQHDAAIRQQEREWWMLRVKAILQKTRFYDELDTALQELVQEATDGSSTPTAQERDTP